MGERARMGVYIATEKNKGSEERVVERTETVTRRSKEEGEWYSV
jgi:hypothetical protein